MKRVLFSIRRFAAFTFLVVACNACGQSPGTGGTGLEGTITISPSHPGPTRENVPNAAPLKNLSFSVENENGAVASFTTDELGKFRVSLKPGHYKVSVQGENRPRRCGPFEVEVPTSGMAAVQWNCDSGMR
jgi:hypothetical protein